MFETTRPRLLTVGLLALGVTPTALLVATVAHLGFCHADPHGDGADSDPLCCEMIESSAHGHHHAGADAEHAHPAILHRAGGDVVVPAVSLAGAPAALAAVPGGPFPGPAHPARDPPPVPLFLSTHALLL